jgi:integrase
MIRGDDEMQFNFTRRTIESLAIPKKKREIHQDTQVRGLSISLLPSGYRGYFWFRKVAGRPTWKTIGSYDDCSIEQARSTADRWNAELGKWKANGCEGVSPFDKPRGELTLDALLDEYVSKHLLQYAKRSEAAKESAEWLFEKYVPAALSNRKLSQIRREHIRDLQSSIAESAGKTSSNRVLQLLRAMFNFALRTELWGGANPCSMVKLFHEQQRKRFIQPDEMPRLFAALKSETNIDLIDFVNLSLWTGARKMDVLSMRWSDISLEDNRWSVRDPKGAPYQVALVPEAIKILQARLMKRSGDNVWVFPSRGRTGHVVDLKGRWKQLLKRAGIENLRQHDLRRTLGSWQAAQGTSLIIIGKSLGHKSLEATAIYSQLNLDPVRESVASATRAMIAASQKKPRLLASARA